MGLAWNLYDSGKKIGIQQMYDVLSVLCRTAKVHRERDLVNVPVDRLMKIVNEKESGHNWIKMDCGLNASGKVDAVIVYHLLKHRERNPGVGAMQWSITVGFESSLVPPPGNGDANDFDNPYVLWALEISDRVTQFANSCNPKVKTFVWIDDDIQESVVNLRKTPIGELAWTAMNNNIITNTWTWGGGRKERPTTGGLNPVNIPGYGKPDDTHIMLTEVTRT